jgi:hypothetical protein
VFQQCIRSGCFPAFLVLLTAGGCNRAEVADLVDKAKQTAADAKNKVTESVSEQVGQAAGEVQEQLQLAGSIELQLDQPLETQACYVHFLRPGSDRSNVLQIQSYRSADQESFPSVFLHAQVSAATVEELAGQVASARLFVQPERNGPVWYSAVGSPVEVKLVSVDEQTLTAEIVAGTLTSTADGQIAVTGSFQGILP